MSFYLIGADIYGPNVDDQTWRDQYLAAYRAGHEIGSHGFYGLAEEAPRGTVENWVKNWIQPTHDALVRMGVASEHIRGFRAPQDAVDPAMYDALELLGYDYANSSATNHSTNAPAWWPGTMENGWPGGPEWDSREYGSHPGIWTVPQTYAVGGSRYCDKDWFLPPASETGADWMADMQETFLQLYNGNRAPLSICLHSQEWGPRNTLATGGTEELTPEILERQQAMNEFLDWLLSGQFPEVRVVSHAELIDWMRNPAGLGAVRVPEAAPVNSP
jgi:peptidoglycan/xylan/chitin deacetylase (PgdA/CDA1 family)